MAILNIQIGQNNPVLRQKAKKVNEITPQIKELISDMIETLEANNGLGLAAPQVNQLLQIIIAKPEPGKEALVLINPQIKKTSRKKETIEEGCLSLPNISVSIVRPVKITVQAISLNGETIKIKTKGLLARIIQHEIDHLNGILIKGRASNVEPFAKGSTFEARP